MTSSIRIKRALFLEPRHASDTTMTVSSICDWMCEDYYYHLAEAERLDCVEFAAHPMLGWPHLGVEISRLRKWAKGGEAYMGTYISQPPTWSALIGF